MGQVTTAMFFLYYFIYGTSFAKVPWVYNSEINSLGWRTRGAAAATGTNWICGFIVTQFTSVGVNSLHWRFYLSRPIISFFLLTSTLTMRNSLCSNFLGVFPYCFPILP